MEKPDLHKIIGQLYVDLYTAHDIVTSLQNSLNQANSQIQQLTQEINRIHDTISKAGSGQ